MLNRLEKRWASYDIASSAYSLIILTSFFSLYYGISAKNAGITSEQSTALYSFINAAAVLLVAFISPVLGALSEFFGMKKKIFKVLLFVGAASVFVVALLPIQQYYLIMLAFGVSLFCFTGTQIIYDSYLIDVTVTERYHVVSSMGYAYGYLGSLIPYIISMAVMMLTRMGLFPFTLIQAIKSSFLISAIWWLFLSIPMIRGVHHIIGRPKESSMVRKSFRSVHQNFKDIKSYPQLYTFLLAFFCYINGVETVKKLAVLFLLNYNLDEKSIILLMLTIQLVSYISARLYASFSKKFKASYLLMMTVVLYLMVTLIAPFTSSEWELWVLGILVGVAQAGIHSFSRSVFAEIAPKNKANQFFGLYGVMWTISSILGPALFGLIVLWSKHYVYPVLSIAMFFVMGMVLLLRLKKYEGNYVTEKSDPID